MTEARTGALVVALAEGVGADLSEIVRVLDNARAMLDTLGEASGAINGLGGDCSGWSDRLATMAKEINKESGEVQSKLLGKRKAEITQYTNPDLAENVKASRKDAA